MQSQQLALNILLSAHCVCCRPVGFSANSQPREENEAKYRKKKRFKEEGKRHSHTKQAMLSIASRLNATGSMKNKKKKGWKKKQSPCGKKFLFTNFLVSVFVDLFVKRSYINCFVSTFNVGFALYPLSFSIALSDHHNCHFGLHVGFFSSLNQYSLWLPVSHQNENEENIKRRKKTHNRIVRRKNTTPVLFWCCVWWNFCVRSLTTHSIRCDNNNTISNTQAMTMTNDTIPTY